MTARSIFEADADDLRDRLDKALVAKETAQKALHAANGRAQRAVAVAELASVALRRAGLSDDADKLQEALACALEGA